MGKAAEDDSASIRIPIGARLLTAIVGYPLPRTAPAGMKHQLFTITQLVIIF